MTRKLYLVDDDPVLAGSVRALLKLEDIALDHFASADCFLAALPRLAPGCILMDIYMGLTDGIVALQTLRGRGCSWPTIMMSGTVEGNDEDLAWASGATDFLRKPFRADDLLRSIHDAFCELDVPTARQPGRLRTSRAAPEAAAS